MARQGKVPSLAKRTPINEEGCLKVGEVLGKETHSFRVHKHPSESQEGKKRLVDTEGVVVYVRDCAHLCHSARRRWSIARVR